MSLSTSIGAGRATIAGMKNREKTKFPFGIVLLWLFSAVGLQTPLAEDFSVKLILLAFPVTLSLLLTLRNPREGFQFWALGIGLLVTQTGFQLDIGQVRTSALEFVILVLLAILGLIITKKSNTRKNQVYVPGLRYFFVFILYSILLFLVGWIRGDSFPNAIYTLKGFIVYPFIIYFVIVGVRDLVTLRWVILIPIGIYLLFAMAGITQYITNAALAESVYRADGGYSAINLYGITLMAFSLLVAGLAGFQKNWLRRTAAWLMASLLFAGAITTVARSVWVAFIVGVLTILLFGRGKRKYQIFLFAITFLIILFYFLPDTITARLLQLSDSSTLTREFYLQSGWEAFKHFWVLGAGWGMGYFYYPGTGLVYSGSIPWYHNDYLNLAVQTGIIGFGLYLAFWGTILSFAFRHLRRYPISPYSGFIQGSLAALVGLLAAAGFEHVLWRPDMAGSVCWMAGILIASILLDRKLAAQRKS